MTTYVFVHGMWGGPHDWDAVVTQLDGDRCVAIDLPSMQRADASLPDDAAWLRACTDELDDDVVLVAHSYGGMVITEAGDGPNVRHLVYVAGALPDVGETLFGIASEGADPTATGDVEVRDDGTSFVSGFGIGPNFTVYTERCRALMQARPRRPASIAAAVAPCTRTAWQTVPATYVVAARDTTFVPATQQRMATRAKQVHTLDWPHFVIYEAPEAIATIVRAV